MSENRCPGCIFWSKQQRYASFQSLFVEVSTPIQAQTCFSEVNWAGKPFLPNLAGMTCSKEASNHFRMHTWNVFKFRDMVKPWRLDRNFSSGTFCQRVFGMLFPFILRIFLYDERQQTKDAWALGPSSFKVLKSALKVWGGGWFEVIKAMALHHISSTGTVGWHPVNRQMLDGSFIFSLS